MHIHRSPFRKTTTKSVYPRVLLVFWFPLASTMHSHAPHGRFQLPKRAPLVPPRIALRAAHKLARERHTLHVLPQKKLSERIRSRSKTGYSHLVAPYRHAYRSYHSDASRGVCRIERKNRLCPDLLARRHLGRRAPLRTRERGHCRQHS